MNTLLNAGHNLKVLDDGDIDKIWESIFYALWYSEMGRGCEEIIAAIERACSINYRLTKVGFFTISNKWYGLDHHRIDKVSHLARHLLPTLLNHQIAIWVKSCKKSRKLGTRDIYCKKLIKKTFDGVVKSYGLCYFLMEILADEISKALANFYEQVNIKSGKFELKADLIVFLYRQVIQFAAHTDLDARLLRTFDQYVFRRFLEDLLPNESQLTQILVTLRIYQAMDRCCNRAKNPPSHKCKALLQRWSTILQEVHEKCINCEYFPVSEMPVKNTLQLGVRIKNFNKITKT